MISTVAEFFLRTGEGDRALAELQRMPRDFFEDGWDFRPKGYLAGHAHQTAGRPSAAQAEWKQALAAVEKRLAAEPGHQGFMYWRLVLQALTGQVEAAREGRKVLIELTGARTGGGYVWFDAILLVACGDREAAIQSLVDSWPRLDPPLRTDLWGDFLYSPWFAAIRDDPRIRAMALEHKAAIDRALRPEGSAAAAAPAPGAKSVAVLAFANLSDDKANEHFSDGISEELLNQLGRGAGWRPAGLTRSGPGINMLL